ncbi:hypothetical protein RB195_016785 [Necator americanus]
MAGLVAVVPIFIALLPAIFFQVHLIDPTNIILSTLDTVGYLALMFTTTVIATDRFVLFLLPMVHKFLSDTVWISPCFAILPWIITTLATIHMNIIGCYKRTDPYALTFTYACSECSYYDPILYTSGYVFPGIASFLYLIIYCRIVSTRLKFRSTMKQIPTVCHTNYKAQDVSLVLQFFLICALQLGTSALFYILPPLTGGTTISYQIPMVFSVMNTMVNPMVIFIFQKRIRHRCFTILKVLSQRVDVSRSRVKQLDVMMHHQ